jgi:predicted metalloprotease with PDZ domain
MKNTLKRLLKSSPTQQVQYRIGSSNPASHVFQVSLVVAQPAVDGQIFALPAWIPGSYMIREFARNIVQIAAKCDGKAVALQKLDKHSWQAAPCNGPLTLEYDVYAWDLSVRAAHLDQSHGFFNASSVFLRVLGQEESPHTVEIERPQGVDKDWRVATSLPELGAKRYGFGTYMARNYDELIDSPVEMGSFELYTFKAHGVPHDVAITGRIQKFDSARLLADLKRICETQIAFFEPETKRAPMQRYVFLTMVVDEGYGGLEHRASTALICTRDALPLKSQADTMPDGYLAFLGLCSHEYFHTWNVKRIKPAVFAPYDLQVENYTPLLWLFEGGTSYYDDLMLVRAGIINETTYFGLLAKTINSVWQGNGRNKQSVADSSFDAWIKYYRRDENTPNAVVSYYTKGSLVALALDLTIRSKTAGAKSLDDLMLLMWQRYGCDFYDADVVPSGIAEDEVEQLVDEICGARMKTFFERYVRGLEELPLTKLLAPFGVQLEDQRAGNKPSLGVGTGADGRDCKLTHVYDGGAAQACGLSAGDVLLALDGLRVQVKGGKNNLEALLASCKVGDKVELHAFRRDELLCMKATLQGDATPAVQLKMGGRAKLTRPSIVE